MINVYTTIANKDKWKNGQYVTLLDLRMLNTVVSVSVVLHRISFLSAKNDGKFGEKITSHSHIPVSRDMFTAVQNSDRYITRFKKAHCTSLPHIVADTIWS